MNNSLSRFERNLGFLSDVEQAKLENSRVAIAGAGGDGGMLAVQLARMGVGEIRLADPDPFEIENINRQAVSTDKTLGTNKAVAVAEYIQSINPSAELKVYEEGITKENTEEFVNGADLLIDETEFSIHALGVILARAARKNKIPNMTALNIGFGTMVTTFKPDGVTLESRLGFKDDQSIEEIESKEVALSRWLPYIPKYGDIDVLKKVASGEKSAPSIAPGVAIAAAAGTTQALLNLVGETNNRPEPIYAPKILVLDAMTHESKIISFNRISHYRHLGKMVLRNTLRLNPKANY